jgi:hypothetical protein
MHMCDMQMQRADESPPTQPNVSQAAGVAATAAASGVSRCLWLLRHTHHHRCTLGKHVTESWQATYDGGISVCDNPNNLQARLQVGHVIASIKRRADTSSKCLKTDHDSQTKHNPWLGPAWHKYHDGKWLPHHTVTAVTAAAPVQLARCAVRGGQGCNCLHRRQQQLQWTACPASFPLVSQALTA